MEMSLSVLRMSTYRFHMCLHVCMFSTVLPGGGRDRLNALEWVN